MNLEKSREVTRPPRIILEEMEVTLLPHEAQ